jgi:hypothetical protein
MAISNEEIRMQMVQEEERIKAEAAAKAEAEAPAVEPTAQPAQTEPPAPAAAESLAPPESTDGKPTGVATRMGAELMDMVQTVTSAKSWNPLDQAALMGEGLKDFDNFIQTLPDNDVTAPLKQLSKEIAGSALGQEEKQQLTKALIEQVMPQTEAGNSLENFVTNQMAIDEGIKAGAVSAVASPMAALEGSSQDPWATPPAMFKGHPANESLFEFARQVTPSVLFGAAGIAAGGGTGGVSAALTQGGKARVAEAALDASLARSVEDDVIGGELTIKAMGGIADWLGFDGDAYADSLRQNTSLNSNITLRVLAFMQSMGIQSGFDQIARKLGPNVTNVLDPQVNRAAKVLGEDADAVKANVIDADTPPYSRDIEPTSSISGDTQVPTAKPTVPDGAVNDKAMLAEMLRTSGIGDDGLDAADRLYFTNWRAITDQDSLRRALQESTATLRKLRDFPDDLGLAMLRADEFWSKNKSLLDDDIDEFFTKMSQEPTLLQVRKAKALDNLPTELDQIYRETMEVTEGGYLVSALASEELGIKTQKLARVALNLDSAGADFTDAVNEFITFSEKAGEFMVPLRRGKRRWAVEGYLQNPKQIKQVKDADVQSAIRPNQPTSADAPGKEFLTLTVEEGGVPTTLRDFWTAYQQGDEAAGETLKMLMRTMAYTEPRMAISQIDGATKLLAKQLRQGNTDAVTNLYYFSMLSRIGTQVASAASNVARLVGEPLGAIATKNANTRAYGLGQMEATRQFLGDGLRIYKRALIDGQVVNSGAKVENLAANLKARQLQLDEAYKGLQQDMEQSGANWMTKFGAAMAHNARTLSNSPLIAVPGRALLAADEGTKAMFAAQVAYGRAFKEATEMGLMSDQATVQRLINNHMNNVFKDGSIYGKITDLDVLEGAKNLTFQSDIPVNGNIVDNTFGALERAANDSAFWKFVSPFTRVSYNILEGAARYEPSGVLRNMVPRYKSILNGEMGDVAEMQLKSQIAFGRMTAATVVTAAMFGGATGHNSGTMPRTSIIVPTFGLTDTGYIAIPYGRLEPMATPVAIMVDLVQALKDRVISEGAYQTAMEEILFSISMATFDKTFQSGMTDMAALFDAKNFGEGTFKALGGMAGTLNPGISRMAFDWANPYQTVRVDPNNPFTTFWNTMRGRMFGGAGNPIMYNELTGKPIPKTTTVGPGDNYWAAVAGSLTNEMVFPGRVQGAEVTYVTKELEKIGFERDPNSSIRYVEGISLNQDQQSILSKDLNDVANLNGLLEAHFKSDVYKKQWRAFNKLRAQDPLLSSDPGTLAGKKLQEIHDGVRAVYRQAKQIAVSRGRLRVDADFQSRYNIAKQGYGTYDSTQPEETSPLESLLGIVR